MEGTMNCQKCQGLMIEEPRPELSPDMIGHRCINCGLYVDPLVQRNRQGGVAGREALVRVA
jgi:hypothetical protein